MVLVIVSVGLGSGVRDRCSGLACCSGSESGQVKVANRGGMKIGPNGNLADAVEWGLSRSSHSDTLAGIYACPLPSRPGTATVALSSRAESCAAVTAPVIGSP